MRSGGVTGIHPTRDGYIYISANTPHFWKAHVRAHGAPCALYDPRFDTVRKRAEHHEEIVPKLHAALALAHGARVGSALWRRRAQRRRPTDRRHVRSPAGDCRRPRRYVRPSRSWPVPRGQPPDPLRSNACPEPFAAPTLNQHEALLVGTEPVKSTWTSNRPDVHNKDVHNKNVGAASAADPAAAGRVPANTHRR